MQRPFYSIFTSSKPINKKTILNQKKRAKIQKVCSQGEIDWTFVCDRTFLNLLNWRALLEMASIFHRLTPQIDAILRFHCKRRDEWTLQLTISPLHFEELQLKVEANTWRTRKTRKPKYSSANRFSWISIHYEECSEFVFALAYLLYAATGTEADYASFSSDDQWENIRCKYASAMKT